MNTVTLSIESREDITRRALAAFDGHAQEARISFPSLEILWSVMTKKRWEILQAMTGRGELTYRAVAGLVGRDVKAVHDNLTALLDAGLVEKSEGGRLIFPYDEIHVDFRLRAPTVAA